MSTGFRVHKKYLLCEIPEELEYQQEGDYLSIGTRFCNGKVEHIFEVAKMGTRLIDYCGYLPKGIKREGLSDLDFRICFVGDYLVKLCEGANKPYYSQWSQDSPVYFYDTPCRWCWHTLDWGFWSKAISFRARLRNDNNDKNIKTWGQLYNAIYGVNAHMQDKGEGGGTYKL